MATTNYDRAYQELQKILNLLQEEDLNIEKISKYVKKAKELSETCRSRLREIETDLDNITSNE